MLRLFLPLILFFSAYVFSSDAPNYEEPAAVSSREGLPSNIVDNTVCVISGEYIISEQDLVIPGPEPLAIQRDYSSNARGTFCKSWSFNHGESLIMRDATYQGRPGIFIGHRQPSGAQLDYFHPAPGKKQKPTYLKFTFIPPKGLTNGAHTMSGQTNARNHKMRMFPQEQKLVYTRGSGDRHTFVNLKEGTATFGEKMIEKVNGSLYLYDKGSRKSGGKLKITCQNKNSGAFYSSALLEKFEKDGLMTLKTSDERMITYHFDSHRYKEKHREGQYTATETHESLYLKKVETPCAPCEEYKYETKSTSKDWQMVLRKKPEGRCQKIHYYHAGSYTGVDGKRVVIDRKDDRRLDRVKLIEGPVGTDKTFIPTHRFVYHFQENENRETGAKTLVRGTTDVYDALGYLTQYHYDACHRL